MLGGCHPGRRRNQALRTRPRADVVAAVFFLLCQPGTAVGVVRSLYSPLFGLVTLVVAERHRQDGDDDQDANKHPGLYTTLRGVEGAMILVNLLPPSLLEEILEARRRVRQREHTRAWKLRNPGRARLQLKRWRETHREHYNAYHRAYRRAHKG